jgi:hypothetical protein
LPASRSLARSVGMAILVLLPAGVAAGEDDAEFAFRPATFRSDFPFGTAMAMTLALRWLQRPRCRDLFVQFQDSSGATLRARLDASGETPEGYLSRIAFTKANDRDRCTDGALAVTTVGSPSVRLCSGFASLLRRDPRAAAVVLIHEALHSLGLGENPPTSQEISRHIEASCR